jgi:hypothetical protein
MKCMEDEQNLNEHEGFKYVCSKETWQGTSETNETIINKQM